MNLHEIIALCLYITCFVGSYYALSVIQFEKICYRQPVKIQILVLFLSMALSYLVSNFLLNFIKI